MECFDCVAPSCISWLLRDCGRNGDIPASGGWLGPDSLSVQYLRKDEEGDPIGFCRTLLTGRFQLILAR